ncbi:MAG: DUF1015 family protein [Verrucomicrobiota bacterium]|nr:DUF1015 family protein [Verrucomicrobiota bacterium]
MLRVKSFQGLRPAPDRAPLVASVPYDVVDRDEASVLAAGNPHSLLHVDRAEIDLPPGTDPYSDAVYAKARENFQALQKAGDLIRESSRCLYFYRQTMGDHSQAGIVGVCHIDDYENGTIKKHELTRRDKEDDRTRLIDTLGADTGPVFLTYRDKAALNALAREVEKNEPLYDFTAPDGIRHSVWKIKNSEAISALFADLPAAYVADGHHRTASAVRVGRERRARNPHHTGDEDYNWFLAVLFPASQLAIQPYNRCVHDLCGRSAEAFLDAVRKKFSVHEQAPPTPKNPGEISMYLASRWYGLRWKTGERTGPIASLDVSVLQDSLLAPLLDIDDPRTSRRIDFVGGIRGTGELEKRVNSGRAAVAFSMYPTTVEQLMTVADAGEIMPPKSTWFEPKLRSGLFIHTF